MWGGGSPTSTVYRHQPQQTPSFTTLQTPINFLNSHIIQNSWCPSQSLPYVPHGRTTLGSIDLESFCKIKDYCKFPPTTKIATLTDNQATFINVHDLRQLILHGKPISYIPIVMFLAILCNQYELSYVDPSFSVSLIQRGWETTKHRFALRRQRRIDHPDLTTDEVIAIPSFINDCHWVSVCCRVINSRVTFFYADDMNNPTTEHRVCQMLSRANTDGIFYPKNASWISCPSNYYRPHSNECGLTLLRARVTAVPSNLHH